MMTNLFSIFDPATSTSFSLNWVAGFFCLLLVPLVFWKSMNRLMVMFSFLTNYIFSEFKPLISKLSYTLFLPLVFFIFIMLNNVLGLLPYIFTVTSHMSVSMMMALPLWFALMIHGVSFNLNSLLIHLVPTGTPLILMPFMVLIETISNIIRPLTLSIRLAANMIAGHLLVTLLTSVFPLTPFLVLPLVLFANFFLMTLETAVAFIQAYVFSVLMTLYAAESVS